MIKCLDYKIVILKLDLCPIGDTLLFNDKINHHG